MFQSDSNMSLLSQKGIISACITGDSIKPPPPSLAETSRQHNALKYMAIALSTTDRKRKIYCGGSFISQFKIYIPRKCRSKINNESAVLKYISTQNTVAIYKIIMVTEEPSDVDEEFSLIGVSCFT